MIFMGQEYWGVRDCARAIGVSNVTVYDWIKKGHFPKADKLLNGKKRLWTPAAINEFWELQDASLQDAA